MTKTMPKKTPPTDPRAGAVRKTYETHQTIPAPAPAAPQPAPATEEPRKE